MNPVLILTHNNLALTKRCVESLKAQDIPVSINIVDNGSTDGTVEWAQKEVILLDSFPGNFGVSAGWNRGLTSLFNFKSIPVEYVLVIGNDTVLPKSFYRTLLECTKPEFRIPFVTGVAVDNMDQALQKPIIEFFQPYPDFSGFIITREVWEKVGPFDERMKHYCSDCDYHIRGHRLGIPMMKASVPFLHERSSTLRLAPRSEQAELMEQADKDRRMFASLYGCIPGSAEYENLFK